MKKEFKPTHVVDAENSMMQAGKFHGQKVEFFCASEVRRCNYYITADGIKIYLHDCEVKPL